MGLAIRMAVVVSPPVLIGVLAWWGVMLAAPIVLVRWWRRRRHGSPLRRFGGPVARRSAASAASPAESASVDVVRGHPAAGEVRFADNDDTLRPPAGSIPPLGQTPAPQEPARTDSGVVAGLRAETLEPLCRCVDFRRRLELAVSELERRLSGLPANRWRIEPYPLTGERRNTLLLLGETGVFVISATYAPGHWDDVIAASKLARKVQLLLLGYRGQVQPAICHPFTSARPRLWHRPDEHGDWVGAWVLGGDSVIDWLEHFGTEHGVGPGDLERFDALAESNWLQPAIVVAPTWPPLPDGAPSRPEE
jgi:hypothetical protein